MTDSYDDYGNLLEPSYKVIDVNLRGTLNFIKISLHLMKKNAIAGSIVITSSATAYLPEQTLPVYSGTKAALINYMRAMRSLIRDSNTTINAVVPAATITKLLPMDLAGPILAAGLPVSTAEFVALAVAYSAVAQESRKVQGYGKDEYEWIQRPGRWNGRTILTLGDSFTELEENLTLDNRIALACRLITLLFLIDDQLEFMSLEEGSAYNEHLIGISGGTTRPNHSIPVEWITYDLWNDMRACDIELADDMKEPVFAFMRAQVDTKRLCVKTLGEYLEYRERDVGQGWEKELKASKVVHEEGAVLCSAVSVLSVETTLSIPSTKRVLWVMCREWELRHKQLVVNRLASGQPCGHDLKIFIKGLEFQMSGNEVWSSTTPRYHRV
ncbi:aristolochene synthase [Stemphylium lycopersici]|uniref:Aristolochene synthase n=1 Tax=Stemphylium lycopersici TaxID=183478 RepID=A0A364MSL0_STELY|nr:aristolochene synthase [Stemphylium lycopersici]RAQ98776.1 aristolochene synthase [Stemphylium lycopersici]RAR02004.1 aristolochene synthase [Stemphylium lycopersici]